MCQAMPGNNYGRKIKLLLSGITLLQTTKDIQRSLKFFNEHKQIILSFFRALL